MKVTPETLTDEMIRELQESSVSGVLPSYTVIALAGPPRKPDRRAQRKIDRDVKRYMDARIACCAAINARTGAKP